MSFQEIFLDSYQKLSFFYRSRMFYLILCQRFCAIFIPKRWVDVVLRRNQQRLCHKFIACIDSFSRKRVFNLVILIITLFCLLVFEVLANIFVLMKLKQVDRPTVTIFSLETVACEFVVVCGLIKSCNSKIYFTLLTWSCIETLVFPEMFA